MSRSGRGSCSFTAERSPSCTAPTLVPLSIYFNSRGRAKVELALAKGRKAPDKRAHEKEKDWKREQGRLLRHHG